MNVNPSTVVPGEHREIEEVVVEVAPVVRRMSQECISQSKSQSSLISIESISSHKTSPLANETDVTNGLRKYLGFILTLLSGLLYSLAALLVKLLKDKYSPVMISVWRFQGVLVPSVVLLFIRVFCMKRNDLLSIWPLTDKQKAKTFFILMLRGILGGWSVVLQFYSLHYLQVGDSMVITSSTSIFVTLLAYIFIGEPCAIVPVISTILAIIGVFIISRPPMITGEEKFDTQILIGVGMALACMFFAALIIVFQRYLRHVHFSLVSFSSGIWGVAQCVILAFAFGQFELPTRNSDMKEIIYLCGLAVLTFFAQSSIIIALKLEQAGPVSIVQSCDVIFAFLWQFVFLNVIPDYFSLLGSLIIIFGILLTAGRKCLLALPSDNHMRRKLRFLLI